jgi:hypothetical protein
MINKFKRRTLIFLAMCVIMTGTLILILIGVVLDKSDGTSKILQTIVTCILLKGGVMTIWAAFYIYGNE